MENLNILVLNLYLLAIFTILVKTKTTITIYRIFKLFNVALFVYILYTIFSTNLEVVDTLIKIVPLTLLMVIIIQTEVLSILKKTGLKKNSLFINSLEDKIKLSKHIHDRCHTKGYPIPAIELIAFSILFNCFVSHI